MSLDDTRRTSCPTEEIPHVDTYRNRRRPDSVLEFVIKWPARRLEMKVSVETDRCVAAGHCVLAAAEVFEQNDDDGVVVLLEDEPGPEHHEAIRQAAILCPAAAIRLSER
jgi:ferredoxin